MDDDSTPPYPQPPEHLPPAEVKRIERVLQRQPIGTQLALAERIRAECPDLVGLVAQNALDVHDMGKSVSDLAKPIRTIGRLAWMAIGGAFTAISFVVWLVASYVGRNTEMEYRMQRCERVIIRFETPGFPVASSPPSSSKGSQP